MTRPRTPSRPGRRAALPTRVAHTRPVSDDRAPSPCRVYGPDGRLKVILDPLTRRPVEQRA